MKNEKKQTGKVNYIWVLAGGYLIYLAFKLLSGAFKGETDQPVIGIAGAVLFIVVGVLVLLREWKAYKYGLDHIDDPDSWSDEEEDTELAELMEASKTAVEKEEPSEDVSDDPEDDEEEQE